MSAESRSESDPPRPRPPAEKESCVPYFDALWFCYSPGHQLTEYYRYGNVDDCTGHWSRFYACLKKRTKYADQVKEEPKQAGFWELRTKEEASNFWVQEFGTQKTGLPKPEPTEKLQKPKEEATESRPSPFISTTGTPTQLSRFFLQRERGDRQPEGAAGQEKVRAEVH